MYELIPHPACVPRAVEDVEASIHLGATGLLVDFCMWGELHNVVLPESVSSSRRDELWKTTCFEVFLRPPGGTGYLEINMSPSGDWATYWFDDYRNGMRDADVVAVGISHDLCDGGIFEVFRNFEFGACDKLRGVTPLQMGISAIIEEIDGRKSYWALAHGAGPPDFHDPACFTATLLPIAAG